ncbi:phenoloxidase-activating factor 3-like [Drosophila eugracilis]|uniref:phenoloxidase-activating factor 3-like n=1 Tax=Drosophila eugracilis TaxID=29029 RepID=UPI001BD9F666|nr:phenoloxidase-activating factor 3-like [Drosophila eugracilis]
MKHFKTGFVALVCLLFWANEGAAHLLENNCGTIRQPSRFKRVVGGQDAEIFSNPWLAILLQDQEYRCTGSLVTSRFVLTVADCFNNSNSAPTKVRLGDYDRNRAQDCSSLGCLPRTSDIDIERVIPHPKFEFTPGNVNNIALVRIAEEILFSDYIRPICLLVNQPLLKQFSSFIVAGWGHYNRVRKEVLQTAIVRHRDIEECKSILQMNNLSKDLICAGDTTSDTCFGDGGTPLTAEIVYEKVSRIFQFGLSSFGFTACKGPSVYTNVTYHMKWIEDTLFQFINKNSR